MRYKIMGDIGITSIAWWRWQVSEVQSGRGHYIGLTGLTWGRRQDLEVPDGRENRPCRCYLVEKAGFGSVKW